MHPTALAGNITFPFMVGSNFDREAILASF